MNWFKKYLTAEIGIEFKASLYFFAILFFYSIYRILEGSFDANIIVMAEMIASTYVMGYVQVYLLKNFEEVDFLGLFELLACIGCSVVYGLESYLLHWFDQRIGVSMIFAGYMLLCYVCMFGVYYMKRHIDTELLNMELEAFKRKGDMEDESRKNDKCE